MPDPLAPHRDPDRAEAPRRPDVRRAAGFTLMEIMVVVVILGSALMLLPANLQGFGARGRLESTGNLIVAKLTGTREQAIWQGYETAFELGYAETEDGPVPAMRMRYINRGQATGPTGEDDDMELDAEDEDLEWVYGDWKPFLDGVKLVGISNGHGRWSTVGKTRPVEILFGPDGNVEGAIGIRIESEDLEDVSEANRTFTIIINPLTSEATSYEGLVELPKTLEASEFR